MNTLVISPYCVISLVKIFIFIEWALFHSQSLCYVIKIYIDRQTDRWIKKENIVFFQISSDGKKIHQLQHDHEISLQEVSYTLYNTHFPCS